MNRWDEIQGLARNIASNVHAEPAARDAMANDLIKLCGAMIEAVGKGVAIDGESNISHGEDESAHARYLVGESIQEAVTTAVSEATGADLDRWTRPAPGDPCACGHVPSVHEDNTGHCGGERFNREPCKGGPCIGFRRAARTGGWKAEDRRPAALQVNVPCDNFPDACPKPVSVPPAGGHYGGVRCGCVRLPVLLGNPEPVNLDGFGATPVAASRPRRCCYAEAATCATCRNGGPIGRCCFPLRDVCPLHH